MLNSFVVRPTQRTKSLNAMKRAHAGFTIIELMISIVLGLLLVAAASQLFWGGVVSARLQQAAGDMQDNGMFGLDYIAKDVRLANYGNVLNLSLSDITPWGGIVLTTTNLPQTTPLSSGLMTHSGGETVGTGNEWTGVSNVSQAGAAQASDQLTIQYQAPANMSNCEGQAVLAGDLVVERYFLREDGVSADSQIKNLALACDANTPAATTGAVSAQPAAITGFGGAGQIIMSRVDQFHIVLGAQDLAGNMSYYTVAQYNTAAAAARAGAAAVVGPPAVPARAATVAPRIVSIQISALVRSLDNTNSALIDPTRSFTLFDQTVTPNTATAPNTNRFVRQVYTTTIALRNALGVNV